MVLVMGIKPYMDNMGDYIGCSIYNLFIYIIDDRRQVMYFFRLILGVFLFLVLVYYLMLALNLIGILTFTEKEIKIKKILIPFYYWFN